MRRLVSGTMMMLVFFLWLSLAGCGAPATDGRFSVSGKVTFQGSPLADGSIQFVSADGNQQTGATIQGGKYTVPASQGLRPGTYTVRISSTVDAGPGKGADEAPGPEAMRQLGKELIPAEYNVQSKLTAEVTASGKTTFDFEIP